MPEPLMTLFFYNTVGDNQMISEESEVTVKDHMLEYLLDLMEDSHDFWWQAAKGCHAVLSVKMGQGKVEWERDIKYR